MEYSESQSQSSIIGPDYVVRSPYPDIQLPTDDVYTLVTKNFSSYGSKIGLIDGRSGRRYSYNEIIEGISKFSSGLQRLGFVEGDVLDIVAPNCPEFAILCLATLATGGVVTTGHIAYGTDHLEYQFRNASARFIATFPAILPMVQKAAEKSGAEKIILLDSSDPHTSTGNAVSYTAWATGSGYLVNHTPTRPDDVVVLQYTSATSSIPKAVMLTNASIGAHIMQLNHPEVMNMQEDDCVAGFSPFSHTTVFPLLASLYRGCTLVAIPDPDPEMLLSSIEKYRITVAPLYPTAMLSLTKELPVDKYDVTSIANILSGGSPVAPYLMKATSECMKCEMIRQAYGLSEASPITHMMSWSLGMQKPDSIGPCLPNMKVKIVDPDSGKALPSREEGELWLQGPNIMKGYLNQPKATQECMTDDGWFKTGDLGYYDETGLFYITDRLKDIICVGKFKVSSSKLEAVLLSHPKIADAAVIGVPDDVLGEVPKAFIVKKEEGISEREVQKFVAGKVSEHQCLKGGVTFIELIPRSPAGKILKRVLRE